MTLGRCKEDIALSSIAQRWDKRLWAQTGAQGLTLSTRQHCCAVRCHSTGTRCPEAVGSPPWRLQKPPDHGPGPPALGVPAGAEVSQMDPEDSASFCHSGVLGFYGLSAVHCQFLCVCVCVCVCVTEEGK